VLISSFNEIQTQMKTQRYRQWARRLLAMAVVLLPLLLPVIAIAAGGDHGADASAHADHAAHGDGHGGDGHGGGHGAQDMFQDILVLLGVVGIAYLVTHLLLERIQRRFGIVSGVEYILMGVILGPTLTMFAPELSIFDTNTLNKFTPAVVLGTGSLGLMTGMNLNFRKFDAVDFEALRIALWLSLVTFLTLVFVPMLIVYAFWPAEVVLSVLRAAICIGAIAMVADYGPVLSLRRFMAARGAAADAATKVAKMCSVMAVLLFGLLFCMFDHQAYLLPDHFGMIEWFGIHLLLGGLLGVVFAQFLSRDFEDDKILTIVIGVVIFTSGIAYYLRLSPIFVNLILGVVLANISKRSHQVEAMLASVQRPLYIVLFFFAGALLTFDAPLWSFALAIPYLFLRSFSRTLGGVIALRTTAPEMVPLRIPALGRVTLAPGALSVAMLLDFYEVFGPLPASKATYSMIIVAIVFSEILSYIRTRSWLLDHTDVAPSTIQQVFSGESVEEVA